MRSLHLPFAFLLFALFAATGVATAQEQASAASPASLSAVSSPESAPEYPPHSSPAAATEPIARVTLEEPGQLTVVPRYAERKVWAHLGVGVAVATEGKNRGSGGLDGALGFAHAWRRLRAGLELRFTPLGGFEDPEKDWTYRVDLGPLHSVVLYQRGSFALSIGTRSFYSRAGTRRVERSGGRWECDEDDCRKVGETVRNIPYRAFYGVSATADLMLEWRGFYLRGSFIRTRWHRSHGLPAPKHQDWVQVSFGVSGS